MDLVPLSQLTFSLIHTVMDSSLVATIAVAPGNSDGSDEDDCDGVRRVAWPGGY